jgi:hypothetical protein
MPRIACQISGQGAQALPGSSALQVPQTVVSADGVQLQIATAALALQVAQIEAEGLTPGADGILVLDQAVLDTIGFMQPAGTAAIVLPTIIISARELVTRRFRGFLRNVGRLLR